MKLFMQLLRLVFRLRRFFKFFKSKIQLNQNVDDLVQVEIYWIICAFAAKQLLLIIGSLVWGRTQKFPNMQALVLND